MSLYDQSVTRLRGAPVEDPYSGEPTDTDWTTPDVLELPVASVQPLQGDEDTFDRETVTTRFWLRVEGLPDVRAHDRIKYQGETYEIDGEVMRWEGGDLSHIQAMLKKVSG